MAEQKHMNDEVFVKSLSFITAEDFRKIKNGETIKVFNFYDGWQSLVKIANVQGQLYNPAHYFRNNIVEIKKIRDFKVLIGDKEINLGDNEIIEYRNGPLVFYHDVVGLNVLVGF